MGTFRKVAKTTDLEPGTATLVEIDGEKIALFNVGGEFCAIDNTCTHRGGPLAEGVIEGDVVTCPWHRATYNVKTGEILRSARSQRRGELQRPGRGVRYRDRSAPIDAG